LAAIKDLDHPNIIKYIDHFVSEKGFFSLISEFAPNGTLKDIIMNEDKRPKTEKEIRKYFTMMCEGLNYLHSKNIIHRDFKPDNIFIGSDGLLKIGDFGLSKIMSASQFLASSKKICTGPLYKAPELVNNYPHNYKVDEWALGITLYFMCS
jgi:NIMA (never in mitosis gene a)-related kinase